MIWPTVTVSFRLFCSYVTASKIIILASGLQMLTACHLRTGHFKQPVVVSLLSALNSEMAKHFHRIEFNSLLAECSILDPRFKRKAFSNEQAANEAIQRLTHAAAQVTLSNPPQEEALMEQGAAGGQPREESMVWGNLMCRSRVSWVTSVPTQKPLSRSRSFLLEALIPRSSNPPTWWKSRWLIWWWKNCALSWHLFHQSACPARWGSSFQRSTAICLPPRFRSSCSSMQNLSDQPVFSCSPVHQRFLG